MKHIDGPWDKVTAFDNLISGLASGARRKGNAAPAATRFELDPERNLFRLRAALRSRTYRLGEYRLFEIYGRKPRTITAAPFPDRVAHHAPMSPVEPVLDRHFPPVPKLPLGYVKPGNSASKNKVPIYGNEQNPGE
uniref:Uncharacterized protein n=1 Tax=Candidatus Kentrum sp. TC TaxID=2126339 RepID=A0A450Y9V3_9GAMM|nr:MAG: hypothetical protein BECKTC1821E_GA0114239_100236 [Candidatus Kentron sp. TC]VFK38693.1 MAG: hypothetical protein BECKTC1821D_GA0114238_100536 [Candidatus Kentron sp. TC]